MSVINTNYLALVSQNNLTKSQNALGTAIERLSSGLRINSAKDDAAGQAIANRFTANIKGLTQAARNANDGVSIAQTTEGALNEINNNLQRIRELTVQAANGSNSESDLASIQNEIKERLDEINRVSKETQFNGKYILGDDATTLSVQVGAHDNQRIDIQLMRIDSDTLGLKGFNVDGSARIANTAASKADIAAKVPGSTWTDNTYTVTPENKGATAKDVFAALKDGDKVTDTVNSTVYTYDAASQSFTYDDTEVFNNAGSFAADAAADILATGATTAKVTIAGEEIEVAFDESGNLTTLDGQALYINEDELTASNVGGGPQATLADLFNNSNFNGDFESIEVAGRTYELNVAGDAVTASFQATISKADLLADVEASTAEGDFEVDLGALYGGTFEIGENGESAKAGGATVYLNASGSFTDEQYGASTTYTEADGKILDADGKQVFLNEAGELTTEADRAGTRTADPLSALDAALQKVDDLRSHLGAIQNRFESTIANLNNTVNNLSAARSRIEDADYAVEVSNMTRAQILQQAGTSVLAQANQVPQTVLSLLR